MERSCAPPDEAWPCRQGTIGAFMDARGRLLASRFFSSIGGQNKRKVRIAQGPTLAPRACLIQA